MVENNNSFHLHERLAYLSLKNSKSILSKRLFDENDQCKIYMCNSFVAYCAFSFGSADAYTYRKI